MRAQSVGTYRQRVTLQDVPETTQDSYGQPQSTPVSIGTYWAEVNPTAGKEVRNEQQQWPTATHQVKLRWLGPAVQIKPQMRFVLVKDGSVLNILNANNTEERDRQWVCYCEEHQGAI